MINSLRAGLFIATVFYLSVTGVLAQTAPQWLFPADAPGTRAYLLTYTVSEQTGAWDFEQATLSEVQCSRPDGVDQLQVTHMPVYGAAQKWTLEEREKQAWLHTGQLWCRAPGTAGLFYDTTALRPSAALTVAMDTLLAVMPELSGTPEASRLSLVSADGQRAFAYLLNAEGWPVAEAWLDKGQLVAWLTYEYRWDNSGRWDRQLVHNRLSGQQQLVERRMVQATEEASGWMAVQGGAAYWLLAENGHARYWDGRSAQSTTARWQLKGEALSIQRADQRESLVYQIKSRESWGWQVATADGAQEDWVWLNALQKVPRKLKRWCDAANAAHFQTFMEKGRTGLRDGENRVVLSAQYDEIEPVHPRLALVKLEERYGLVQTDGKALFPIYFEKLEYLGDSLLLAQRNGGQGILHLSGDTLVPFVYERLIPCDDTTYWAFAGGEMGLINDRAAMLLSPQFDLIHPFYGNQAVALENGQTGVIDTQGQWVVSPGKYTGLIPVDLEGYLVQAQDNNWGFINREGQLMIEPVYGHLRALTKGVLVGQQEGRFGLLRTTGELLTPMKYRMLKGCGDYTTTQELCQILAENNAVAQFVSDDRFGYFDARGQAHPPVLPSPAELEADYKADTVEHGLILTYPKTWQLERSIQKLYKQGDYGQSRVVYEFLPAGGQSLEDWAGENLAKATASITLGQQPALAYTERERVRYYDFFRKHIYCLSEDGQTVIHLELSCKDANFLESIPDLYEIGQLLRFEQEGG
jgi:hypothetical protein